jgi:Skp family chaperone for outer membrane proteins
MLPCGRRTIGGRSISNHQCKISLTGELVARWPYKECTRIDEIALACHNSDIRSHHTTADHAIGQQRSAHAVKRITTLMTLTAIALTSLSVSAKAQSEVDLKSLPVKIGLVDMAKIFKEYDKFNAMREELKGEMQVQLEQAQKIAADAKKISDELALIKKGTEKYITLEQKLARLSSDFETKRKLAQANYVRREAEIFEKVYTESTAIIKLFAEHFNYTLILRFNSEPVNAEDPKSLATSLNKLVIYNRPSDDLTSAIVAHLNKQYAKTTGRIAQPVQQGTSRK